VKLGYHSAPAKVRSNGSIKTQRKSNGFLDYPGPVAIASSGLKWDERLFFGPDLGFRLFHATAQVAFLGGN
jgi:hypothetical protein